MFRGMDATAETFLELTTPHLPRLHRIGMRLTHDNSESQDLVQEALTRAWANWARTDRNGRLGAWLSRIVVNTFISRYRHRKVVHKTAKRSDIAEHLFDPRRIEGSQRPEDNWIEDAFSDEVSSALGELPTHYREVIESVDIAGESYKSAAETLNIPLGTVMSRLYRARRQLRNELADYAQEFGFGLS